ncbi:MAG: hypothetical protein DRH37_08040 [Deltaproteobacteria bacterium]|nr:MAG: hypothetical protein DRH37_08040 [Deltaproteobacteria bacterium]
MTEHIHIAVIGGGVIGCAVAWALCSRYEGIFLFERNPGVTRGENQSTRNSGVIHSGIYYDRETRPLKADLCLEGNRRLYTFCERHKVPALRTGKLIVAVGGQEKDILEFYLDQARTNKVPGVRMVSGAKIRDLEPNVKGAAALQVPSAGIVDPVSLVYRLHVLASQAGVHFVTGTEIIGLEADGDFIRMTLRYRDGKIDQMPARVVINAAGVDADRLAALMNPGSPYELNPVRGESCRFYGDKRPELRLNRMNVYPTPEIVDTPHGPQFTVGVHLTPTFQDLSYPACPGSTVTVGPKLVPLNNRTGEATPLLDVGVFLEKARGFFPGLREGDLMRHQTGIQARLKGYQDFVVHADPVQPNFISLLGIDSPGLTSCLAIAERTRKMVDAGLNGGHI